MLVGDANVNHFSTAVQNAAARMICGLGPCDHVILTLYELHGLPVELREAFKLCDFMHLFHTERSPSYSPELVTLTFSITSRSRLRSVKCERYEQPATRLKLDE